MRRLMMVIVAVACLGSIVAEEGRNLKSLVSPQTLLCELRDIRLTRAIDEISDRMGTETRGKDSTTTKTTQIGTSKRTSALLTTDEASTHFGYDTRFGVRGNAEVGYKFGLKPAYGSIGGGVSFDGSVGGRKANDWTTTVKTETEDYFMDTDETSSVSERENVVEGTSKFGLGEYRLVFSIILRNRDVNDELTVDGSRMKVKLRGSGLTGEITVPCREEGEFTLGGADEKSFEFVYQIKDEKTFGELNRLCKNGQLDQLSMSKNGADIPVISKKSGTNVIFKQSVTESRRPSTAVVVDVGEFRKLPFWRVSRRHTAQSGRQGAFVTLREAFKGIELSAFDFRDNLPKQIFEFSKDGSLVKVLDDAVIKKDNDGHYHVLALRLKDDKTGDTSLGLPSVKRLALNIKDYSEIAIISFTFDELAQWAVWFPRHFATFRKEIENWLAGAVDTNALPEFQRQLNAKQHDEDIRPLHEYGRITKDDVDRFRERAEASVPEMWYKFARCLLEGWGISKDEAESVKWFRKAAEQGNADGQFYLGYCYMCGIGVAKVEEEAFMWYRKAAKQGHVDAKANIELQEKIDMWKIKDAAEDLSKRINVGMSRSDIYGMIVWIEKLAEKLRGRNPDLVVKIFTPPDPNYAYERVKANAPRKVQIIIACDIFGLVAWKNDAQRVFVVNNYLNRTTLLPVNKTQDELARFDIVTNIVEALNKAVDLCYKNDGGDFMIVKNSLSLIRKRLKTNRTRFLSYEVVSPYLYEAHCYLFSGRSSGKWHLLSSDNIMNPQSVKWRKQNGVKLLKMISDHTEWLNLCTQDVRQQFDEIQRIYGQEINEELRRGMK